MARNSSGDIGALSATQLSAQYKSGKLSPVDATRAALDRIERFNPSVNAYTYVDTDGAVDAAHASARRWGQGNALSPLDGVPVSLKDLTRVKGMPAREGSLLVSDEPCDHDAPPARLLREAGAVLLGKTNTPEFGWEGVTDNRVYGPTRNPWDTRLTPGGSSGGAAVAAALNMGVLHQGGDSGGSIRIPASFTGVFGFKPTFGWTPQWPPAVLPTLSHLGPLTRNVKDAALMLNAMGRYDYRDPYALRGNPDDWGAGLDEGIEGLRIAYSPTLCYAKVDPEIGQLVGQAAQAMSELGAEVEETDPGFECPLECFTVLWLTGSQYVVSTLSGEEIELLDQGMVGEARRAKSLSALELFRAQRRRAELTQRMEHFHRKYHLLLTPSVPIKPFEVGHTVPLDSDMGDWMEWTPFTYPFNLTRQPAASIPCGFTDKGLPVGFQLAAGKFDDVMLMRACHAYMEAYPPEFPEAPEVRHAMDSRSAR